MWNQDVEVLDTKSYNRVKKKKRKKKTMVDQRVQWISKIEKLEQDPQRELENK